jgi:hypothetical protein
MQAARKTILSTPAQLCDREAPLQPPILVKMKMEGQDSAQLDQDNHHLVPLLNVTTL